MALFGQLLADLEKAHLNDIEGYRKECEKLRRDLVDARKAKHRAEAELQKQQLQATSEADGNDYVSELSGKPTLRTSATKPSLRTQKSTLSVKTTSSISSGLSSFIAIPRRLSQPAITRRSSTDSKDKGSLQNRVARVIEWEGFDLGIGFVIVLNSIYIGFETQHRMETGEQANWLLVADISFTTIYTVELLLRFFAVGFCVAMKSPWVQFDSFLVATGIFELIAKLSPKWSVGILEKVMVVRLMRLLKLARMLRLMTQFKTLWLLVNGLINSFMTIIWTLVLLGILIYIFSIFGLEVIQADQSRNEEYNLVVEDSFGSLFKTVLTLFQFVTLDSIGGVYRPIILEQPLLGLYFLGFIILVSIALMNLVTAMMVECALDQSGQDKEARRAWEVTEKTKKINELRGLFNDLDQDKDGLLTMEEFETAEEDVQLHVQEICGTDDFKALFKCLDTDSSGTIDIAEFCDGIDKSCQGKLELHLLMLQTHKLMHRHQATHSLLKTATQDGSHSLRPTLRNGCKEAVLGTRAFSVDTDGTSRETVAI
jgi:hypothetical protein